MTHRRTRTLARFGLGAVVVVLAVFGDASLHRGPDAGDHGAAGAAVLASSTSHNAPAVAERPSDPAASFSVFIVMGLALLTAGAVVSWVIGRPGDHRSLAFALGLRDRRRGPPRLFTV